MKNVINNTCAKVLGGLTSLSLALISPLNAFAEASGDAADGANAAAEAAETAEATPAPGGLAGFMSSRAGMIVTFVVYIGIFVALGYFLIFRPQKKRKAEEEKLRSSLMLGDEVVTIGGICGKIVNIKDDVITVETSIDRTLMEFKTWAIRDIKKLESDDRKDDKK